MRLENCIFAKSVTYFLKSSTQIVKGEILPFRLDPRDISPQRHLAIISRHRSSRQTAPPIRHHQNRKQPSQPHLHQPLSIHILSIPAQSKEQKHQKATSKICPSVVKNSRWHDNRRIPSGRIVEFGEIEGQVLVWVLGDDDIDLDGCDAEDENRRNGEDAEEATASCVAAGEDIVEGGAVFVEADDDEDCKGCGLEMMAETNGLTHLRSIRLPR